jgi:hypothetical protein
MGVCATPGCKRPRGPGEGSSFCNYLYGRNGSQLCSRMATSVKDVEVARGTGVAFEAERRIRTRAALLASR